MTPLCTLNCKHQECSQQYGNDLYFVAESEADIKTGKISVSSPIGKGLLGTSVGDIAEVIVPNGVLKFEILSINR